MAEIAGNEQRVYFIAHDGDGVYHIGYNDPGQTTTTGQPHLEQWETEAELLTRAAELLAATESDSPDVGRLQAVVEAGTIDIDEGVL